MSVFYKADGTSIEIGGKLSTDTTPIIEYKNKAFSKSGAMVDAEGYGITSLINLIDVPNKNTPCTIKYYLKNSGTSLNVYKLTIYDSGTFADYYTVFENDNTSTVNVFGYEPCDGVKFALKIADIDDSYAYVEQTGQVLFAGKNTAYYGKSNIKPLKKYGALPSGYITQLQNAYNALVTETDGNYNRIPFIAYTDQHSAWDDAVNVFNAVDYFCDWSKFSAVYQLGDCTGLSGLARANTIIPFDKQINVIGNHDMQNLQPLDDHTSLMKYFRCGGNARQFNRNEWWTIIDELRNVKYIVINDLEMPAGETYTYWYQSAEQVEWFAKELEKADGYDVVILTHCNFGESGNATKRDGTAHTRPISIWMWNKDSTANASFYALLSARKNKTSGTYTDSDGNSISYDFTNCDSELLMALHGHDHTESYQNLTNSITSYAFECFYDNVGTMNTIYFGYIDRVEKKFKNWKLYDGITAIDVQEIDIQ